RLEAGTRQGLDIAAEEALAVDGDEVAVARCPELRLIDRAGTEGGGIHDMQGPDAVAWRNRAAGGGSEVCEHAVAAQGRALLDSDGRGQDSIHQQGAALHHDRSGEETGPR